MGAENGPPVAALRQCNVGQRTRCAGAAGEHGVRPRGDDFQDLTGDRAVGAGITLVGQHFDASRAGIFHQRVVDQIAPGVGEADVADRLDALFLHLIDDRADHQRCGLRNGHHPGAILAGEIGIGNGDQRRLGLARNGGNR